MPASVTDMPITQWLEDLATCTEEQVIAPKDNSEEFFNYPFVQAIHINNSSSDTQKIADYWMATLRFIAPQITYKDCEPIKKISWQVIDQMLLKGASIPSIEKVRSLSEWVLKNHTFLTDLKEKLEERGITQDLWASICRLTIERMRYQMDDEQLREALAIQGCSPQIINFILIEMLKEQNSVNYEDCARVDHNLLQLEQGCCQKRENLTLHRNFLDLSLLYRDWLSDRKNNGALSEEFTKINLRMHQTDFHSLWRLLFPEHKYNTEKSSSIEQVPQTAVASSVTI